MSSGQLEETNNAKREHRRRHIRRVQAALAVLVICMGLITLSSVAGNPRFETYHSMDVARLVIAGASFGCGLVLLIQFFIAPDPGKEAKKE